MAYAGTRLPLSCTLSRLATPHTHYYHATAVEVIVVTLCIKPTETNEYLYILLHLNVFNFFRNLFFTFFLSFYEERTPEILDHGVFS